MNKQWQQILAFARDLGYTGKALDWKAVRDFLEKEGAEVALPEGETIESIGKRAARPTIEVDQSDDVEPGKIDEDRARVAAERRKGPPSKVVEVKTDIGRSASADVKRDRSPLAQRAIAQEKAYNRRVKRYEALVASGRSLGSNKVPMWSDGEAAAQFGAWLRRSIVPDTIGYSQRRLDDEILSSAGISVEYRQIERDEDDYTRASTTISPTLGAAIVPEVFIPEILENYETYSLAMQLARVVQLTSGAPAIFPLRTGGLQVYLTGEATSITESNPSVTNVEVQPRTCWTYTSASVELINDSAINWGEWVGREIVQAFGEAIETDFFVGDGSTTYHKITGIAPLLASITSNPEDAEGLIQCSGDLYSEATLGDFEAVVGVLPEYADKGNATWVCHKKAYAGAILRLADAAGGLTKEEVLGAGGRPRGFLNYPLAISQAMYSDGVTGTGARDEVHFLLGDFSRCSIIGIVGGLQVAQSEHIGFQNGTIAIRGMQRFGISFHSLGSATVAGPVVGLVMKDS